MSGSVYPYWVCGCGSSNGINLDHCGRCRRSRQEAQEYEVRESGVTFHTGGSTVKQGRLERFKARFRAALSARD